MKSKIFLLLVAIIAGTMLLNVQPLRAQEKMTMETWQSAMNSATAQVTDLQNQIKKIDDEVKGLKDKSDKLDADLKACNDALLALLGVTQAEFDAFERDLSAMERRVAELQAMSDAELLNHKDEIDQIGKKLTDMSKSKIALIPRYGERIRTLQEKVAALHRAPSRMDTYTVGTWAKDRDCLWNIAKKKDIYDNAWLWPKIWQGNRDKIKDPDIIKPHWVLKIPEGKELTKAEKSAGNSYYHKKAAEPK